jgi:dethiobiotin synthetase
MEPQKLKFRGVFISATDTSVGKTTLAAGLIGFLRKKGINVGVMKPVASGAIECDSGKLISQDAEMLVKFSESSDPWEWINPYCLATPVNPALAAKIEGVTIDLSRITRCFEEISHKHDFVVVEGAGGLMSPVFENLLVRDMICAMDLPVVIVSRAALGTINHTLMTFECLSHRGIETLGFFLNRFPRNPNLSESTNAEIITSISGVPHLGSVPELGDFFSQHDLIEEFSRSLHRDQFLEILRDEPA